MAASGLPHPVCVELAREAIAEGPESYERAVALARAEAFARSLLRPVINATGVLLHTNLGRAPFEMEHPPAAMNLTAIDWAIVVAYFALSMGIGILFTKKGGESIEEYFLSGRNVSWWLAGASMVATTFAADTPLVVTGLVSAHGVAGNWLWWNMLMSGMLTVFFFARLWRRANVMTDVEFAEVRYSGKPAATLRIFRALYLAIPINLIILGWVTRAMIKILTISLGLHAVQLGGMTISGEVIAVGICFVITMAY
jgi:Na+/proline symporter